MPRPRVVDGQAANQPLEGGLGRAVEGGAGDAGARREAADGDDAAEARQHHVGEEGAAERERGAHVHRERGGDLGVADVVQLLGLVEDGGAEDEQRRRTEGARRRQRLVGGPGGAEIDGDGGGLASGGAHLGGRLVEVVLPARGDGDMGALAGERARDRPADAAPPAGDQRDLPVEAEIHVRPS
jgi:hypothetical protein